MLTQLHEGSFTGEAAHAALPKCCKLFFELFRSVQILQMPPVAGEEAGVLTAGEAVVQQQDHALVLGGADDPPGGLQNLVHAGIPVGIIEAGTTVFVVVAAQDLLPGVHLRQPNPDDGAADEPVAHKVHALAEDAAHHPEAQQSLRRVRGEPGEKGRAGPVVEAAFLHEGGNGRVAGRKSSQTARR